MDLEDETVHLKAGDIMIQRGTIHNWINRGTEPCVIAFILNTGLYVFLSRFGFVAMNYATPITGWLMVGVYVWTLHKQIELNWKKLVGHTIKVGIAAIAAGLVAWLISKQIPYARGVVNGVFHLIVAGGLGAVVYVAVCSALRVQEVEGLRKRILRR